MKNTQYSAWNPGIESDIPAAYRELETIYRPENVTSSIDEIDEFATTTGLKHDELVVFRPMRLALHELIVRVNADIVVREGEQEEDLGINFRTITDHIFRKYLVPIQSEIEQAHEALNQRVHDLLEAEFSRSLFPPAAPQVNSKLPFLSRFFGTPKKPSEPVESTQERQFRIINSFKEQGLSTSDELGSALYRGLYRVLGSIIATRGHLGHDQAQLIDLTSRHICSRHGSRMIGKQVDICVRQAIEAEGYDLIPDAQKPMLISLKGTSAAGKSSLRPRLQKMIRELGIEADGYGTISPDIWRRLLLDYDSLGEAYKYAGRLTSNEMNIVDRKLDQYIRGKANFRKSTPHLVVDRFRFDSFESEKISRILHKTYAKYTDTMYMYFIVTPPEATVERGWERGLVRGRYKSVEDFLGHCVEAYAGMPKLLFKWLSSPRPKFIFEFLDNSVPEGNYPRTMASGTQGSLDIYDPIAFIDIERYQKINVMAHSPDTIYPQQSVLEVGKNIDFFRLCIRKIERIRFIDRKTEKEYLSVHNGIFKLVDTGIFERKIKNADLASIFSQLAPGIFPVDAAPLLEIKA